MRGTKELDLLRRLGPAELVNFIKRQINARKGWSALGDVALSARPGPRFIWSLQASKPSSVASGVPVAVPARLVFRPHPWKVVTLQHLLIFTLTGKVFKKLLQKLWIVLKGERTSVDLQLLNSVLQSAGEDFIIGKKSYQSFIFALGDIDKNINTCKIQNGHKDFQPKTSLLIQIIS